MLEHIELLTRAAVLAGEPFGAGGAYEQLSGRVTFATDPDLPANAAVVDLSRAARGDDGRVRSSADWWLLRPVDAARANGTLLYDVVNRGNKTTLMGFQGGTPDNEPAKRDHFGDGFLLERGFTVAAVAWQGDLRPGLGRMTCTLPVATDGTRPLTGPMRLALIPDRMTPSLALMRPDHTHYPPLDLDQADAVLTVRDTPYSPTETLARERWVFAVEDAEGRRPSPDHVWLEGGFEAGRIYEVIYAAADPLVAGLGFTNTRDFVSFLRFDAGDARGTANPLLAGDGSSIKRTIAYGASQSGRFLRQFVYQGFNRDEQRRQVFDGLMVYIAAAGMGSFNHRFAQPSRTRPHANSIYPVEVFPFADDPQTDQLSGRREGLLDRARAEQVAPRIMYINTSAEYWGGGASLQHTDPLGTGDVPLPEEVRIYHIAGAQHVAGPWPPAEAGYMPLMPYPSGKHPLSPIMVKPLLHGLLASMDTWLRDGSAPPASAYPSIAEGTLVSREAVAAAFPAIPGVQLPAEIGVPLVLDYGPDWAQGIMAQEPPTMGPAYRPLLPAVNADGNEPGGVQLPELVAPLATYTGWSLRHPGTGNPTALVAMLGAYLPFPATAEEAQAAGDPRPPIAARYCDREEFLQRIEEAIAGLVARRLLLEEDAPAIRQRAAEQWEAHAATAPTTAATAG